MTSKSIYEVLSKVNVTPKLDKKGKFSYLSWADAITVLLEYYPSSIWETTMWLNADGTQQPYCKSSAGCFVQVVMTIEGITRTQIHPILDHRNKTITTPNAFDVNTSIQRCLAKVIALFGLSLYVYRGEDLPPDMNSKEETELFDKAQSGMIKCLENDDGDGLIEIRNDFDIEQFKKIWHLFDSGQRSKMKVLMQEARPDA